MKPFYVVVRYPDGDSPEEEALRMLCAEHEGHSALSVTREGAPGALALVMSPERNAYKCQTRITALRMALLAVGRSALDRDVNALVEQARVRVKVRQQQEQQLKRLEVLESKLGGMKRKSVEAAAMEEEEVDRNAWDYSEQTHRVKTAMDKLKLSFKAVRTRSNYYDTPLAARAEYVGALSEQQMLKMVVVENSRFDEKAAPGVSRYLVVLVQYAGDGFSTKALNQWFRKEYKQSKSRVNWRLCDKGESLTGFLRNGLCPFGSKLDCPVVLDSAIGPRLPKQDPTVWLGGGEIDVKINVSYSDLEKFATHAVPLTE